jgi:N-acetylglutamate synthase-like GNAT family acetyltransferase
MNAPNYRVRRATLDDIGQLTALWQSMNFPIEELSRRITDFQVAETAEGTIVGAVALQMADRQGRIHSESFTDFALAEPLRPMIWDRFTALANNHGLLRLWTQEQAPFWGRCELAAPDADTAEKLPALWRNLPGNWLTIKLREDVEALLSLDKEFAAFKESEKQRTQRAFQQAKLLKTIATLIAFLVLGLVFAGAFLLLRRNPSFFKK